MKKYKRILTLCLIVSLAGVSQLMAQTTAKDAMIYNPLERAGLSSFDLPNMQKNSNGSVTLYFGPKAPKGKTV